MGQCKRKRKGKITYAYWAVFHGTRSAQPLLSSDGLCADRRAHDVTHGCHARWATPSALWPQPSSHSCFAAVCTPTVRLALPSSSDRYAGCRLPHAIPTARDLWALADLRLPLPIHPRGRKSPLGDSKSCMYPSLCHHREL
jgi:hypothetical protein